MAKPTRLKSALNSSVENSVRSPGMDSSLSMVPPVCPKPRPLILETTKPVDAKVVLWPRRLCHHAARRVFVHFYSIYVAEIQLFATINNLLS